MYQGLSSVVEFKTAVGFQTGDFHRYEIDSKAMRKVGINEDINQVGHLRAAVAGEIILEGRMLIKLH